MCFFRLRLLYWRSIRISITADEAEKEYDELLADAQTMSDEQFVAAKLDLLTRIADGDRSQAAEYAAVVRKITDGDYVFADEDVFSFVRELVDVYSALENGELTDGVQSITLQNDDGAATVSISHIACPEIHGDKGGKRVGRSDLLR